MASPPNPLDVFTSYIYHFELHAADSWDKLKDLSTKDENKATTRFEPNGTLLINTRKDAHQHLDDVKYTAMAESSASTELLIPVGLVSMTVTEPGGFSFIEKLDVLRRNFQVTSVASDGLVFLLKIMFVGRRADNSVDTLTAKLIPMILRPEMTASFNEKGGQYNMSFTSAAGLATTDDPMSGAPMNFGFVKRNVSFKATTIEGAFKQLEKKLNAGYEEIFMKEGNAPQGKPLTYKITWDPEIKGKVDGLYKSSLDPAEARQFVFNPTMQIGTFIHGILKTCSELQERIGASKAGLQKEFHPDIFIPVIQPRVIYHDDSIEVNFHVAVNKGGVQKAFVFDYYFSDAGKNVDVMSYDVKFVYVGAWIPTKIDTGHDWATNQSGTMQTQNPKAYSENSVTSDTTRPTNYVEVQRSTLSCQKNDPQYQPGSTYSDRTGHNSMPHYATPAIRMASDAIIDFQSAIATQQTFEIRGHLDILNASAYYPDGTHVGELFGGQNIWIKVNIYMLDDRAASGKRQFFYTNYYKLLSVENSFSSGQFKQHLTVTMFPEIENR